MTADIVDKRLKQESPGHLDANEVIKLIKSARVDTGTEDHKIQAIKHHDND